MENTIQIEGTEYRVQINDDPECPISLSRPSIGIPYARADVDGKGYFVTCPECGDTFYGTTKGSTKKYGVHYAAKHESAK